MTVIVSHHVTCAPASASQWNKTSRLSAYRSIPLKFTFYKFAVNNLIGTKIALELHRSQSVTVDAAPF